MAIGNKLKSFLASPRGQQMMEKGRQQMAKPENQAKIRNLMNKVKRSR